MGATIRDVARQAQVSISTVSRVLNGTCPVADDKRRRVEAAAAALGYVPNPAARSLLKRETGGLGVVLPFVGGEFFSEFLTGIDEASQELGYFVLITSSHRREDDFRTSLNGLNKRVDGLLIMATEMDAGEVWGAVGMRVPTLFVNTADVSREHDAITFDNRGGMRAVTEHLARLGHRRIGIINGSTGAHDAAERLAGYREALDAAGLAPDPALEFEGDYSQESGREGAQALLGLDDPPTAIAAANDYGAMGALSALRAAGLRVPEDVSLTGFDDITSAAFTTPPLTTVRVPLRDMGRQAVQRLVAKVRLDDAPPTHLRLPVELVVRGSTAAPP